MHTEHSTAKSIQCPQCNTRFRVKAEQLLLADGLVRCSVCMSIFSGIDEQTNASILLTDIDDNTKAEPPVQTELERPDHSDEESLQGKPPEPDLLAGLSTVNHDFEHHLPRRRPIQWFWLLANTLALLVLIAQLALWQKAALFASPIGDELRKLCPLHSLLCEDAPKQQQTASDIVSTKLVVRKHPSNSDALQIDTILLNRGADSAPFPKLELRFSDIKDNTIAQRTFQPSEYLAGELNQHSLLASQQPVHIALEIIHPGLDAVNYQLKVTQ